MNSPHNDAVLNFDLDFLHPSTNNIPVQVLKQRYITQLKRRIIRVDALQNHRNSINQELSNKTKELEDIKKKFEVITQEYTRTSLEYKEALESSAKWEKETQRLKVLLKAVEDERFKAVNELEAIQSHTAQLEQLVKQQERKIEHLDRYEKKHVDKLIAAKSKENEKEILLWKRKYEALRKQFQDKKKSNKESLHKYDKLDNEILGGAMLSDEHSDNEDNTSVDFTVPFSKSNTSQNNARTTQKSQITGKDNTRSESETDCRHDVVSVDTGCGSSLSSSDNEKWLNSPDFVFSPIHLESLEHRRSAKCVNTATSPLPSVKMVARSSSPIPLVKKVNVGTSAKLTAKVINVATSPITVQIEDQDRSHEPELSLAETLPELHQDIEQPSTNPEGSIESSSEKIPCVVREKMPDKLCSSNELNQEPIIDETIDSAVESMQTIYIDIEDLKEEECLDSNMEEDCVIDYEDDLDENKNVVDLPNIETQTMPEKEFLNKELVSPISDGEICYGALRLFDKLPSIPLESEWSDNKTDESRLFDEVRSPILEITPSNNEDHTNDEDPIINSQINSMEVETSQVVEPNKIDKIKLAEYSSRILDVVAPTSEISLSNNDDQTNNDDPIINSQITTMEVETSLETEPKQIEEIKVIEHSSRIFDEVTSPPLEITPRNNEDRTNNDNPLIHSQINSTQVETLPEIKVIEYSNDLKDEDKIIDNVLANNKIDDDCVVNSEIDIDRTNKNEGVEVQVINEKACLELNNSAKTNEDRSTDNEIEMILSTMRIQHKLITPIPRSPKYSICVGGNLKVNSTQTLVTGDSLCADAAIAREYATAAKEEATKAKIDAAKTREENKKLMAVIDNLFKDVCTIKRFLKDQFSLPDLSLEHIKKSLSSNNLLDNDNNNLNNTEIVDKNHLVPSNDNLSNPVSPNKIKIISDVIIMPANTKDSNANKLLENPIPVVEENQPSDEKLATTAEIDRRENETTTELNETVNEEIQPQAKEAVCEKSKKRKLTNLDKYRKKCESRNYKIKRQSPPLLKSSMKPKGNVRMTKKVTDLDTSATLNDTDVYAKAVKVMAELNSKIHKKCSTGPVAKSTIQHKSTAEESKTEIKERQNIICQKPIVEESKSEIKDEQDVIPMSPDTSPPPGNMNLSQTNTFKPVVTYPRRSMRSPGLVLASPKPINSSPRHSLKSPDFAAVSPPSNKSLRGSMKSPEFTLASTKPMVMSPRHSIKSPDFAAVSPPANKSSRGSMKSPEFALSSTKPMVTSPRHSIKSPDFAPVSLPANRSPRRSMKSPEFALSSTKPMVTSPRHSIKSPDFAPVSLPANRSPRRSMKSPEFALASTKSMVTTARHSLKSPDFAPISLPANKSPRRSIKSPEFALSSTKPMATTPRHSLKSPEALTSPTPTIKSPRSSLKSPENVYTSKSTATSPRRSIKFLETLPTYRVTSPRRAILSPELTDASSKPSATSPRRPIKLDNNVSVTPQKPAMMSPKRSLTSPEFVLASPKPSLTSPRRAKKLEELFGSSPTPEVTSPKWSISSPELVDASQKRTIPIPKRYMQYPGSTATSPTFMLTSPQRSIRSPESDINPNPRITSPPRYTKSAGHTIASLNQAVGLTRRSIMSTEIDPSCPKPAVMTTKPSQTASRPFITSPEAGITYSELNTSSGPPVSQPETAVTNSRMTLRSPKPAMTSSKLPVTPKYEITSPKATTRSSKPGITSPKYTPMSPKPAVTSPKYTPTSPKSAVTSPTVVITCSKLPVTSPGSAVTQAGLASSKPTIRSPKPSITSPKVAITSAEPHNMASKLDSTLPITTSRRSKINVPPGDCSVVIRNDPGILDELPLSTFSTMIRNNNSKENQFKHEPPDEKSRKRTHSGSSDSQCTRVLRSKQPRISEERTLVCYADDDEISTSESAQEKDPSALHPKETILCTMIEKYAVKSMKTRTRQVSDKTLNTISEKIEQYIEKVKEATGNKQHVMNELVQELQKYKHKDFVSGLVHYVTNPIRRLELHTKTSLPPAPQMTKSEEVLLYVIKKYKTEGRQIDFVETILSAIEYVIFKMNRTPEFEVIEGTSHFYALVCRYFNLKHRLIVYMLDAMYCIMFKAVPLIRQCLDVWPHVIPLAHMSVAKTPLVTCFVYLLHFYKCEDKYNRVQDIRNLLARKYFYEITEWNESKILEYFNNAIRELRNISNEKKMLRIALIILSKRNGPKWTQTHIIKKMLLPFIEDEKIPVNVQEFCLSMLGPLMKPYPADMNIHCEIVMNKLTSILSEPKSQAIEEAALTSFILMNRHDIKRVVELLLSRKMQAMSPEFEKILCTFVRSKPLHAWLKYLKTMNMQMQTYN